MCHNSVVWSSTRFAVYHNSSTQQSITIMTFCSFPLFRTLAVYAFCRVPHDSVVWSPTHSAMFHNSVVLLSTRFAVSHDSVVWSSTRSAISHNSVVWLLARFAVSDDSVVCSSSVPRLHSTLPHNSIVWSSTRSVVSHNSVYWLLMPSTMSYNSGRLAAVFHNSLFWSTARSAVSHNSVAGKEASTRRLSKKRVKTPLGEWKPRVTALRWRVQIGSK